MIPQVGKAYNHITVIKKVARNRYLIECDCGRIYERTCTNSDTLRRCKTCADLNRKTKHGSSNTRLYSIWMGMKQRVTNPNNSAHKYYIDKGITICEEWLEYLNFKEWALNNGYQKHLTIDRVEDNKDYCPENCRWITQSQNSKRNSNAKLITIDGETHDITDWCKLLNISHSSVRWAVREKGYTHAEYIKYRKDNAQ